MKANLFIIALISYVLCTASCLTKNDANTPEKTPCGKIKSLKQGTIVLAEYSYDSQDRLNKELTRTTDGHFKRLRRISRNSNSDIVSSVDSTPYYRAQYTIQYDANHRAVSGVGNIFESNQTTTRVISYRYAASGKLEQQLQEYRFNGIGYRRDSITYEYNSGGKITAIKTYKANQGSPFQLYTSYQYTYDAINNGQIISVLGNSSIVNTNYTLNLNNPYSYPLLYNGGNSVFFYNNLDSDNSFFTKQTTKATVTQGTLSSVTSYNYNYNEHDCITEITNNLNGTPSTITVVY